MVAAGSAMSRQRFELRRHVARLRTSDISMEIQNALVKGWAYLEAYRLADEAVRSLVKLSMNFQQDVLT